MCTYWPTESVSARGQMVIGRNSVYFMGKRQESSNEIPLEINISITYRDVNTLELVAAKRVLIPDPIQIGIKDRVVYNWIN